MCISEYVIKLLKKEKKLLRSFNEMQVTFAPSCNSETPKS